ncbi:MAG: hypothetical protein KGL16_02935 [Acidobacteriota bacterium]|nr:hypothetical protein [Acidobacteriota bacterium]
MSRRLAILFVIAAAALAFAAPALANVHVPRGTTVNEIRVLGQDVRVDGRVRGPVIVVGGSLTVGPTGQASNVTVIGGSINTLPGGRLGGDVFQFGGEIPDLSGWRLVVVVAAAIVIRGLLVWLLVAAGRALAASRRLAPLSAAITEAPARALATGALAALGAAALTALLAITVVGIPVALMLLGLLLVGVVLGLALAQAALPHEGGRRLLLLWLVIPAIGDALLALALALGAGAGLRVLAAGRRGESRLALPRG